VYALAAARWTAAETLRFPATWIWAAAMAATWPVVVLFTPLGLTTEARGDLAVLDELLFLALIVGTSAGLLALTRVQWLFSGMPGIRRIALEFAAFAGACAPLLLAAALPFALLGRADALVAEGRPAALALTAGHTFALGSLVARTPFREVGRALLVPVLAWLVPALVVGGGVVSGTLDRGMSPARYLPAHTHAHVAPPTPAAPQEGLRGATQARPEPAHSRARDGHPPAEGHGWKSTIGPMIGLLVVSAALANRRPSHALRDPR